jgi:hypothetical protein
MFCAFVPPDPPEPAQEALVSAVVASTNSKSTVATAASASPAPAASQKIMQASAASVRNCQYEPIAVTDYHIFIGQRCRQKVKISRKAT